MELQTPDAYVACLNSHLRQDISQSVYMQGPHGFWKQKFSLPGGRLTCFLGPPLKEGLPRLLTMEIAIFLYPNHRMDEGRCGEYGPVDILRLPGAGQQSDFCDDQERVYIDSPMFIYCMSYPFPKHCLENSNIAHRFLLRLLVEVKILRILFLLSRTAFKPRIRTNSRIFG